MSLESDLKMFLSAKKVIRKRQLNKRNPARNAMMEKLEKMGNPLKDGCVVLETRKVKGTLMRVRKDKNVRTNFKTFEIREDVLMELLGCE